MTQSAAVERDAPATDAVETGDILRDSVVATLRRMGGRTFARALQRRDADAQLRARALFADSGWRGVIIAEELGGSALGIRAAATVAEELGRVALPSAYTAQCVLSASLLAASAAGEAQRACLRGIAAGATQVAAALGETGHALDRSAMKTTLSAKNVLNGRKTLIAGADGADHYIVAARRAKETVLCLIPAGAKGATCRHDFAVDGSSYGTLDLRAVRVTDVLATGARAEDAMATALDRALIVASAELYGVMSEALEITLGYMRTRVQFGRPIGAFQALQHRAAELFVQKEIAFSVVEESIELVESAASPREIAIAARRAKARCSDAALRTVKDAVQLHGAIGYTDEYDVGLYLKRAMVLASWLGNGVVQRREYMRLAHGSNRETA